MTLTDLPGPGDVLEAAESLALTLDAAGVQDSDLGRPAGDLEWTCGETLAHVSDAVGWYAANLARRSTSSAEFPDAPVGAPAAVLIDTLLSAAALLAVVVKAADPTDRAWHSFGIADRSGFAAMGCDEILVHGYDLAKGLGFDYTPPPDPVERTLRRIFPWAPGRDEAEPWDALLWANGRIPLGDRPPETQWLWHCAPLDEWNGEIRRWKRRK